MKFLTLIMARLLLPLYALPIMSESNRCDYFDPPFGPANYSAMGFGNLPYQEAHPNALFCAMFKGNTENDRYVHTHLSEFVTTKTTPRGTSSVNTIPEAENIEEHMSKIESIEGFSQLYDNLVTDALVVINKGKIYYEKYESPHSEDHYHSIYSCTKSYVGLIAAMLAEDEGYDFDPEKPVSYYLPELANPDNIQYILEGTKDVSYYHDMTVRNVMDMAADISYSEYDPNYGSTYIFMYAMTIYKNVRSGAIGFRNMPLFYGANENGPGHGKKFDYKSLLTLILGMVLESSKVLNGNGKLLDYFYDNVWSKLGQENKFSITVDWQHHPQYFGGGAATARDMARFGMMMLNNGKNLKGEQVVPIEVVKDILDGGTQDNIDQMNAAPESGLFDAYRNQFWVRKKGKIISQIGIHGQYCYIDVENDIVIVKHASSSSVLTAPYDFRLFDMLTDYFNQVNAKTSNLFLGRVNDEHIES